MTKVLVTGGVGGVGKPVVAHLMNKGYDLRIVDLKPDAQVPAGVEYAAIDINDYSAVLAQMRGCDQVVHLAAIPTPSGGPPEEVFRVNAAGTFNIFQAAAELGIRRVVQASSINAVGLYYGVRNADPQYFPVDEEHPQVGTDAYSFSKWVVEEIAEFYWRRAGISSVSLRFPAVLRDEWRAAILGRRGAVSELVARLQAMSESERLAWVNAFLTEFDQLRAQGMMENPEFQQRFFRADPSIPISEEERFLMITRNNFWALIDERDAAQAVEKGLSADYEGAHPMFVSDHRNTAGVESEELLRLFFPNVTARKRKIIGRESLVSIEKARRITGFWPEYSFTE